VRKTRLDALAISLMVLCCSAWALQQILIKAAVSEIPPMLQAGLRFAGSSVLLAIWCRVRGIRLLTPDGSLWVGLLAGLLFTLEFVCIYLACATPPPPG